MEAYSAFAVCAQLIFAAQNELIGLLRKIELSHSRMKRSNDEFSTVTPPPGTYSVGGRLYGPREGQRLSFSTSCCFVLSLALHLHFPESADRTPPLLSVIFRQGSRMATQSDIHT